MYTNPLVFSRFYTEKNQIIAPQAQLEESANDRGKPEVPFNRDVKRNPGVVLRTRFGGICDWYLRFGCPEPVLGDAPDRPDSVCPSACVRVCVFVPLFVGRFLDRF